MLVGRTGHSWKDRRFKPNVSVSGRTSCSEKVGESTETSESLNFGLEQAQKSNAIKFSRPKKSLARTTGDNSSSICSCAKNSCSKGVNSKHCRRVSGTRFLVLARSRAVHPAPVGLKWLKSRRRTMVPREG